MASGGPPRRLPPSEELFERAFEDAPIGMAVLDLDGRYLRVNPAHCRLLGYEEDELLGMRWPDNVHPEDRPSAIAWLEQVVAAKERRAWTDELRYCRSDGETLWIIKTASLVFGDDDEPDYFICQFVDVTERRRYEAELERRTLHDHLTGLPNRVLFTQRLRDALQRQAETEEVVAVIFLDLDEFKRINDGLGHGAGDQVLIETARRLTERQGPWSTTARFAGDSFTVLIENIDTEAPAEDAVAYADGLLAAIADEPYAVAEHEVVVRASAGVAVAWPPCAVPAARLLSEADAALYRAKRRGGGVVELAHEETIQAAYRLRMETDLRDALAGNDGLWLAYQPIVDLRGGAVVGLEALLRWNRRGHGPVMPGELIPVAEEAGLIIQLGNWVLRRAVSDLRDRRDDGTYVAVNLGARQFTSDELPGDLRDHLEQYDVRPERICIEITEGVAMADADAALSTMRQLKDVGVRIAIDDFGTGFSSLGYLKRFPADTLKIDRVFVSDVARPSEDRAIVRAVLSLAEALGLDVVAEGVETEDQREVLEDMGVLRAQGFLFAHPAPLAEVAK